VHERNLIEVKSTGSVLVKHFAAAVAQKLVNTDLKLKSSSFVLLEQLTIGFAASKYIMRLQY
jgi:hypothetical protein